MADMLAELVTYEQSDAIVTLTLNRPDKRNAMNWEMMSQLDAALDAVERLAGVRVVIVRGAGQSFSAGIDLMGFPQMVEQFGEGWRDNLFHLTATYQSILNKIERCTYPVIALLHNACIGMGLELALACDFRIAAEGTRLALPETKLGLIPDVGGTTRLTRLIGVARAKEYIMTGRDFDLADAERWGLVNYVVPPADLTARGMALADELIACAPLAVSYAKKVIDGMDDLERGFQLESWAQSVLMRTEDFANGAQAMMTREKPQWKGK